VIYTRPKPFTTYSYVIPYNPSIQFGYQSFLYIIRLFFSWIPVKTPEQIEKTAAFHRGRKRSDETRAKISAAAKSRSLKRKEVTE